MLKLAFSAGMICAVLEVCTIRLDIIVASVPHGYLFISSFSPVLVCSSGPVYEELYDSAKISSLKGIRNDQKYNNCVAVHRAFGDIFVAYEGKRSKLSRHFWSTCYV